MKAMTVSVTRSKLGALLEGACECGGDLLVGNYFHVKGRPRRVHCGTCNREYQSQVLDGDETRAELSLPYRCLRWERVVSSNLDAVGVGKRDLIVRFKDGSGAVYRYTGAAPLLEELLAAESKGKFFAQRIRKLDYVRVCSIYGCVREATVDTRCAGHAEPGYFEGGK